MELNEGIVDDIAHVDLDALLHHVRVLLHHQPANVREEEPAVGVVGVRRGLRVLVVHAMVPNPFENGVLSTKIMP